MKFVGAHVSAEGGVDHAPLNARNIGAKAFALFTKNQRQWLSRPLSIAAIDGFHKNMADCGFAPTHVLPHDGYLINLGNPDPEAWQKSFNSFVDELQRCEQLGLVYLNTHPGSSLKKISDDECLYRIADSINQAHRATKSAIVVLENTAGQGSNMGHRFEHLAQIIDQIEDKSRVGVCLDTCHTFAAGYDLSTPSGYKNVMDEFDRVVGFKYLKGVHLNDSKGALGSRLDRHQSIGKGELGLDVFSCIMNDPRFDDMPLILETIDETLWQQEIVQLYGMER